MSNQDPIALTFRGQHKGWWYGGLAIVIIVGLLRFYGGDSGDLDLEVRRGNIFDAFNDGAAATIVNTGHGPITVTSIAIDDRSDCRASSLKPLPTQLKVGEQLILTSNCRIIRMTVNAKEGSESYSF